MPVLRVTANYVKVEPDLIDEADILEYARVAIEEFGWRQGERKETQDAVFFRNPGKEGLSLHDSISYACSRLGVPEEQLTPDYVPNKEGGPHPHGSSASLRFKATTILNKFLVGRGDRNFNDAAKNVSEVLDVLRQAEREAINARNP